MKSQEDKNSKSKEKISLVLFGTPKQNQTFLNEIKFEEQEGFDFLYKKSLEDKEISVRGPRWAGPSTENVKQDKEAFHHDRLFSKSSYIKRMKNSDSFIIPIEGKEDLEQLLKDVRSIRYDYSRGREIPIMVTSESDLSPEDRQLLAENGLFYLGKPKEENKVLEKIVHYSEPFTQNELKSLPDPKKVLTELDVSITQLSTLLQSEEEDFEKENNMDFKVKEAMGKIEYLKSNENKEKREEDHRLLLIKRDKGSDAFFEAEDKSKIDGVYKRINDSIDEQKATIAEIKNKKDDATKETRVLLREFKKLEILFKKLTNQGDTITRLEYQNCIGQIQELQQSPNLKNANLNKVSIGKVSIGNKLSEIFNSLLKALKFTKEFVQEFTSVLSFLNVKGTLNKFKEEQKGIDSNNTVAATPPQSSADSKEGSSKRLEEEEEEKNASTTMSHRLG